MVEAGWRGCYGGAMREAQSCRYWDEGARENALYYIDNELEYGDPDAEMFWGRGEEVVELMLDARRRMPVRYTAKS